MHRTKLSVVCQIQFLIQTILQTTRSCILLHETLVIGLPDLAIEFQACNTGSNYKRPELYTTLLRQRFAQVQYIKMLFVMLCDKSRCLAAANCVGYTFSDATKCIQQTVLKGQGASVRDKVYISRSFTIFATLSTILNLIRAEINASNCKQINTKFKPFLNTSDHF